MKQYSGIIKLVCLFILAPIVIWKFALGSTYNLYKERHKIEKLNNETPVISQAYKPMPSTSASEPLLSNGKILKILANTLAAEEVEVLGYTPEIIDEENNYKLYCGKLELSGGYIDLVKVVSAIEKAGLPIKIASMEFGYDRKKKDAPKKVSLQLVIEQIEGL